LEELLGLPSWGWKILQHKSKHKYPTVHKSTKNIVTLVSKGIHILCPKEETVQIGQYVIAEPSGELPPAEAEEIGNTTGYGQLVGR
jgi:hypothetical protein